ncbi:hypothetical protein SLOPH_986 [Spraguea lophii 42_110]|uniref:Uncharacterized protein n=1 Tax=Spraguea lophii (strain 42_110) TaxID=1358809 RepID=S7XIL1_SPRLO|nr:hypothetical protein SLOPH_986 [Spraguea lophii 42_110]
MIKSINLKKVLFPMQYFILPNLDLKLFVSGISLLKILIVLISNTTFIHSIEIEDILNSTEEGIPEFSINSKFELKEEFTELESRAAKRFSNIDSDKKHINNLYSSFSRRIMRSLDVDSNSSTINDYQKISRGDYYSKFKNRMLDVSPAKFAEEILKPVKNNIKAEGQRKHAHNLQYNLPLVGSCFWFPPLALIPASIFTANSIKDSDWEKAQLKKVDNREEELEEGLKNISNKINNRIYNDLDESCSECEDLLINSEILSYLNALLDHSNYYEQIIYNLRKIISDEQKKLVWIN